MEQARQAGDREPVAAGEEAVGEDKVVWGATRLAPELAGNVCVPRVARPFLIKQEHRAIHERVRNAAQK